MPVSWRIRRSSALYSSGLRARTRRVLGKSNCRVGSGAPDGAAICERRVPYKDRISIELHVCVETTDFGYLYGFNTLLLTQYISSSDCGCRTTSLELAMEVAILHLNVGMVRTDGLVKL